MCSYTIHRPESHEAWLEARKNGIGSSDAGTILGVNHFSTPLQLWQRRMGLIPAQEESEAMQLGHAMEPAVAEMFEKRTEADGLPFVVDRTTEGDWFAINNDKPFLRVSPDRLVYPKDRFGDKSAMRILECKTTSAEIKTDEETGEFVIPDYWYAQVQYQMGIMEQKECFVAWIASRPSLHFDYARIPFNKGFYDVLISKIEKFWNDNILGNTAPEGITSEDAMSRFPRATADPDKGEVEADAATMRFIDELRQVKADAKSLKEREDALTGRIQNAMGEASFLKDAQGNTMATWTNTKAGMRFDPKKLQEADPETFDRYTFPTKPTRQFRLK